MNLTTFLQVEIIHRLYTMQIFSFSWKFDMIVWHSQQRNVKISGEKKTTATKTALFTMHDVWLS